MKEYSSCYVWFTVLIGSFGFFEWGYVNSISSSVLGYLADYVFPGISSAKLSLIASIVTGGGILGAFLGGPLASKIGRRKAIMWFDWLFLVGTFLTLFENYSLIIAGRIIEGIVIGLNTSVTPLYVLEMTPSKVRGPAGVVTILSLNAGIMLAFGLGFMVPKSLAPGETNQMWKICYALIGLFPLTRIIAFLFVLKLDTPSYLISQNKEQEAALILKKIYRNNFQPILDKMIQERDQTKQISKSGNIRYKDLFSKRYRKAVLVGVVLASVHQLSGINGLFIFAQYIFEYGITDPDDKTPQTFSLILSFTSTLGAIIPAFTVERFGRKKQLITNLLILAGISFTYSFIGSIQGPENIVGKVVLLAWPIFFSLSLGSVTWLYLGEVMPDLAMSISVFMNWLIGFVVAQVFLDLAKSWGLNVVFFIFTAFMVAAAVFFALSMIESKGKSKEEILALYAGVKLSKTVKVQENPEIEQAKIINTERAHLQIENNEATETESNEAEIERYEVINEPKNSPPKYKRVSTNLVQYKVPYLTNDEKMHRKSKTTYHETVETESNEADVDRIERVNSPMKFFSGSIAIV